MTAPEINADALPFSGLKVIDCASYIAGPAAAMLLSDFGADVIKIEPPEGDPHRDLYQRVGAQDISRNFIWDLNSRNKRSLALDLKHPAGQAVLQRLVAQADVFITNLPLPVRGRLGISAALLRPLNPRLVYASMTGYGETGPEAAKTAFDVTAYWARSGLMDLVRDHSAPPTRPVAGMGDHPSASTLFAGITMALYRRERTGLGGEVRSSLMANGLWSNGFQTQAALCGATFTPRPPREQALNALTVYYRCRDDRWLILTILNEDRQWPVLAQCLDREDLIRDPRFVKQSDRFAHAHELISILDEAFSRRTQAEWRERLGAGGIVFEVVAGADDIVSDKQALANGFCVPFEDSTMLTIDSPFFVAGADKVRPRLAPEVGEHSDQILREAGYDVQQIEALRAAKAVA